MVPPDKSVLAVIEDARCRRAVVLRRRDVRYLRNRVLGGVPDHRDSVLDAEEQEAGDRMMICVSRARSPRLVLDL